MFNGMLDAKKTLIQLRAMKRDAGFLKPMDRQFAEYYQGYQKIVGEHHHRLNMMMRGGEYTLIDTIMQRFRRKLKEALDRLHGQVIVPSIPQVDIEDLLRK